LIYDLEQHASRINLAATQNTAFCSVKISWTPPAESVSPLQRYKLEVQDQIGNFYPLSQLCKSTGGNMLCEIPMETFTSQPFNLEDGAQIRVRASAFGASGWGTPSDVDDSLATVQGVPQPIDELRISLVNTNSVMLAWDGVSNVDKYEIYFTQGDDLTWNYLTFTRLESFEALSLVTGVEYQFKVRAKNSCGNSSFSNTIRFMGGSA
jgi:hypothetical protein